MKVLFMLVAVLGIGYFFLTFLFAHHTGEPLLVLIALLFACAIAYRRSSQTSSLKVRRLK